MSDSRPRLAGEPRRTNLVAMARIQEEGQGIEEEHDRIRRRVAELGVRADPHTRSLRPAQLSIINLPRHLITVTPGPDDNLSALTTGSTSPWSD